MPSNGSPIGRQQGKADTDNNGLARYTIKIETPAGIKSGNEPDLSLQYSQGTPNGIMGFSWALGGVSSIHLAAPMLVYDKINPPPRDYDTSTPKLAIDGVDLLNIKGAYSKTGTVYTTETDNIGLKITSLGELKGFIATDNMGRKTEYGTTPDSLIISANQTTPREWRVKRQTDCHGNTVEYSYIPSPQPANNTKDVNTSYLAWIYYCSNSNTKAPASRFVQFDYQSRPDLVKRSVEGAFVTWANLLSSISIGVLVGGEAKVHRSYSLSYGQSAITGDSFLSQVMEITGGGTETVSLLPSSFTYTAPGIEHDQMFFTPLATPFSAEQNIFALVPLNMTGKALADMACMAWDATNQMLTVKTYMADRVPEGFISWTASQNNVQVQLPKFDPHQSGAEMPNFLTPDLHGDGRSDLIIPFQNAQGCLEFFLSQSNGVGLTVAQQSKPTTFPWVAGSTFMAMDMTGTGIIDVVQIYQNGTKLSFRNFPGVADDSGYIGLKDAVPTDTQFEFDKTIDWFLLKQSGTRAVSLVRVWQETLPNNPDQYQIKATAFRCAKVGDSSKGFHCHGVESILGGPFYQDAPPWNILPCDINGDGTQDIVLAQAQDAPSGLTFTFLVSLGDGLSGFTQMLPPPPSQTVAAPAMATPNNGIFSVTNINGGLYPSLAYVYKDVNDKYVCLSADGRCDGTVNQITQYPLTPSLPDPEIQVMTIDLNGSGMGGWLIYSLYDGSPDIVPVYNLASPTDLLSTAHDSMGLVSTFQYGCLSDPTVYSSGVDWKAYNDTDPGSYIVQGAPNYVVKSLSHTNNSTTNSLPFNVLINKTYQHAVVNTQGRGWMGFESINSTNSTDQILTIEHYFQQFPKVGLKFQIDTFTLDKQSLSSQKTDYAPFKVLRQPWNIYHVNKMFDQLTTGGMAGRVQLTKFSSDENGNIITKYSSEIQSGTKVFESWERCSYETINSITGLLTGKKLSSVETNEDVSTFQQGDVALTHYTYNKETALLDTILRWSDDAGKFLATTYEFDSYGNEISVTNPAGLTTSTTYDTIFHNLAVKQTEDGEGVSTTEFVAYDQASGEVVAKLETNGRLVCTQVDSFGRSVETRMKSITPGKASVTAQGFFSKKSYVAFPDFVDLINSSDCFLDPFQTYSYNCFQSKGEKAYLTAVTLSYFNEDATGQHEVVEVLDCSGERRMQRSRQGVDPATGVLNTHVSWKYWTYDSRGNVVFESFPLQSAAWDNFEYQPKPSEGTTSVFDQLGRVLSQTRPSHNDPTANITSSLNYSTGGAQVLENVKGPDPNFYVKDVLLWSAPRSYISINGKEHVTTATNQDGMVSQFQYDVSGNMIWARDPNGNKETREYNSLGQLRIVDNCYQKMVVSETPSTQPAMTYEYDGTGQLYKTINANGDVITFQRDSKGRPTHKIGFDGRLLKYEYDVGCKENLSSMTIYPKGSNKPMETKLSFEYDALARLSSRILTLADGKEYKTTFQYDWQGQTTMKSYPNGAAKRNQYFGALLLHSQLYGGPAKGQGDTWLDSKFEYTDATGRPNNVMVGQSGKENNFSHTFTYDLQAYPLSHALELPSTGEDNQLVEEKYVYNGADQLAQRLESNSPGQTTTKYNYAGKRLISSQIGDAAVKHYNYDRAGNLSTKGDTTITYSSNGARGTTAGLTSFDILYDGVGRMVNRSTQQSTWNFSYDSFGVLASFTNSAEEKTTITSGPDGKTVQRDESGDGGSLLLVSDDYNVRVLKNGSTIITVKLFGADLLLGSLSETNTTDEMTLTSGQSSSAVVFTDNKGNVTYRFDGSDGSLLERITYDDFGTPTIVGGPNSGPNLDSTSTYESKRLDQPTGLFDFGARWYDPLVGRFTTPDDVLSVRLLARTDGLNRLAFENNDPINHTDPSGKWSLSAVLGAAIGGVMVVAAAALTIATGGAAAPLAAAAAGALAGGGIAGISYSFENRNERGGKFWAGYAATVLVNAAIGGATGALGAVATPARLVSATGRLGQAAGWSLNTTAENVIGRAASVGSQALIGATSSLLQTVAHNAIENKFYNTHYGLFEGAGKALETGAFVGVVGGGISAWGYKGESVAEAQAWKFSKGVSGGAKIGARAGYAVVQGEHLPEKANQWANGKEQDAKVWFHHQQDQFRALSSMVGTSGFVGTLHNELQMNQSYVNYG